MRNSHCMGGKLDEKWNGPYTVHAKLSKGRYKLETRNKIVLKKHYSSCLLKEYFPGKYSCFFTFVCWFCLFVCLFLFIPAFFSLLFFYLYFHYFVMKLFFVVAFKKIFSRSICTTTKFSTQKCCIFLKTFSS